MMMRELVWPVPFTSLDHACVLRLCHSLRRMILRFDLENLAAISDKIVCPEVGGGVGQK